MPVMLESIGMELSEEQFAPVTHALGGPALVIAGAGSGKTRVMTARVKWLIAQGVHERRIAGITFTNKAADELRHRVGYGDDPRIGPRVSTIHSLSLGAIRKQPRGFGLSDRVSPLDSHDAVDMIRRLLEARKKDPVFEELNEYALMEKMSYHRARGVGFAVDYDDAVHEIALHSHKGYHAMNEADLVIWREFELAKRDGSVVDFDDMLHLVVRRGREDDGWRTALQKMFVTVLVDEGQDVNAVQWAFIELLLHPDNRNLFCVGDLGQSIYAFNGAAPEILGGMVENWRGVVPALYRLEDNYRSLEKVVKFSNGIQKTMTDTVPLLMKSKRGDVEDPIGPGKIKLIQAQTSRDVSQKIADTIAYDNKLKRGRYKFKDNAILVRSKGQIRDIEDALISCRIPYVVRGGQSLLQTEEARDLFSYLRLIVNPADVTAFGRAISVPKRGIGDSTVEKLRKDAVEKFGGDLVMAAANTEHMKLRPFGQFIQELMAIENPVLALDKVIHFTAYKQIIQDRYKKKPDVIDLKRANLDKIREAVAGLIDGSPGASAADIIFRITMNGKEEAEKEDGVVVISTIHSAKGLEWPRVFVTNVTEGSIPHQWSSTEKEIEEDRRLLYVACTRAGEVMTLCVPAMVMRGPNAARVRPSRFLAELGINC